LRIADCGFKETRSANPQFKALLERICSVAMPELTDIEAVLRIEDPEGLETLFDFAAAVRRQFVGDGVLLRGIIEFSNVCRNTCLYCGLNRGNRRLRRYRLTHEQILASAEQIRAAGIKTVVLQSGEEDDLDADWLREIIAQIKSSLDLAVTLCVGERSRHYEIYPNKRCVSENTGACPAGMEQMVTGMGRWMDYSRGDSLKKVECAPHTIKL
jgi:2-iminoacetate synthase ThiH